jgi:hypothetical protein
MLPPNLSLSIWSISTTPNMGGDRKICHLIRRKKWEGEFHHSIVHFSAVQTFPSLLLVDIWTKKKKTILEVEEQR